MKKVKQKKIGNTDMHQHENPADGKVYGKKHPIEEMHSRRKTYNDHCWTKENNLSNYGDGYKYE